MENINATTEVAKAKGSTEAAYVDKKSIARHLGISVRKVDYLRNIKVLPCYVFPTRCIRFHSGECEEAIKQYRE